MKKNRSIDLSVVLYGCENWSFTLKEIGWLKVFENMVLSREYLILSGTM